MSDEPREGAEPESEAPREAATAADEAAPAPPVMTSDAGTKPATAETGTPTERALDVAPAETGTPAEHVNDESAAASGGVTRAPLAPVVAAAPAPSTSPREPERAARVGFFTERPEHEIEVPRGRLAAQTRRDFLLFTTAAMAAGIGAWWLLPDRARTQLVPEALHDPLDTVAARLGLSTARRERALDRALTFDDDVAEALYSRERRVRTYDRSQAGALRNNYDGMTPSADYLPTWSLKLSGLASGHEETLRASDLAARLSSHEQVTRLVCVEGWSAVAWWGGFRFAELLRAFPPASAARWAALRSAVNLDGSGRPDPYYVSIDLETARHEQTLLATHLGGRPLTVEHGAPLRLVVPMKLGLKNIKAITEIEFTVDEPRDYWNERGYSKYDGL